MSDSNKKGFSLLNQANYSSWADNMQAYLSTKDLWLVTSGEDPMPVPAVVSAPTKDEKKEKRDWLSAKSKAAGEIWLGVEEDQKTHLKAIKDDPLKMWEKLKEVHQQKKPGTRFAAYDVLFSIRKQEDESLSSLMGRTQHAMQSIQDLRPDSFDITMLDEELQCMTLIRSLPAEYNSFVSSLLLLDSLTLDKLLSAFQNEETQRAARNVDADSTILALQAGSAGKCFFCDGSGHMIKDCNKYKQASAAAKAGGPKWKARGARGKGKQNANEAKESADESANQAQFESAGHASALSSSDRAVWLESRSGTDWNADTGASSHMTPHRAWFRSYSPHVVGVRLANNSIIYSAGIGSVEFQPVQSGVNMRPVIFHDVLHVPALGSNLLSLFHLTTKKGYEISIVGRTVNFLHNGTLLFTASVTDRNVGYLNGRSRSFPVQSANRASTLPLDLSLWHRRCSHLNHSDVRLMQEKKLVTGMPITALSKPDPICEPCIAGKQRRHNIPQTATRRTTPLALVHTDLKGPMPVQTPEGYRYWMTFVDDATRFWVVAFLKKKSDAFAAFVAFKAYAENALGSKLKMMRDDGGGEYIGKKFILFCIEHGIVRQHTEPNEPHQNGAAERPNLEIANGATALMVEAKLPPSFWARAVSAFVHTRNRTPTSALGGGIPYTAWKKKKPDISYFRVFGCLAYVLIRKEKRKALQPHSRKCIFIGYPDGVKAWLFWDPADKKFITSSHAVFDERYYPGNSPTAINLLDTSVSDVPSSDKVPLIAADDDDSDVSHHGGEDSDDDNDAPPPQQPQGAGDAQNQNPLPPAAAAAPPPPPPPARRQNPPRAQRPKGSQNLTDLQRRNVPAPSQRIPTPAAAPPPPEHDPTPPSTPERSASPDPLEMSPPHTPVQLPSFAGPRLPSLSPDPLDENWSTPRKPAPVIASDSEEEDEVEADLDPEVMYAGLEFLATAQFDDYLTMEEAADVVIPTEEFALRAQAFKAASPFQSEPRTFKEAMARPEPEASHWLKAATAEINALVENGTFQLVELPPGQRAIGSRWVFKVKRNADGSIERYKGRVVAQGFSQRPGFDYTETFAPTPQWAALRAILAVVALEDLECESVDISSAFLNGVLQETVFMRQPEGFEEKGPSWVWRLIKSLYGLKQSGRVWHLKLNSALESIGFKRIVCEHSVWVYLRDGVRIIIPVFIDDMTIAAKSKSDIQKVKDELKRHFKLRDLGPTSFLLGVEITRDRTARTLCLNQRQYILDLLKRFGFENLNSVTTPMDPNIKLSSSMSPKTPDEIAAMHNIPYTSAVGAFGYLATASRPDISCTVGNLARFSKNPGWQHWLAVKHLCRYLIGTLDYKITYSPLDHSSIPSLPPGIFQTYTDANHVGDPDTGRSTSGYVVKVGTGAISWRSRLQTLVALSTTEAEFIAAVAAGTEIKFLRNLFTAMGYKFDSPSVLHIDNNSALSVAKNPEHHGRMKHLDLRFYWLRDEVEKGTISLKWIPTDEMPADILTKALGRVKVLTMVKLLGLRS